MNRQTAAELQLFTSLKEHKLVFILYQRLGSSLQYTGGMNIKTVISNIL